MMESRPFSLFRSAVQLSISWRSFCFSDQSILRCLSSLASSVCLRVEEGYWGQRQCRLWRRRWILAMTGYCAPSQNYSLRSMSSEPDASPQQDEEEQSSYYYYYAYGQNSVSSSPPSSYYSPSLYPYRSLSLSRSISLSLSPACCYTFSRWSSLPEEEESLLDPSVSRLKECFSGLGETSISNTSPPSMSSSLPNSYCSPPSELSSMLSSTIVSSTSTLALANSSGSSAATCRIGRAQFFCGMLRQAGLSRTILAARSPQRGEPQLQPWCAEWAMSLRTVRSSWKRVSSSLRSMPVASAQMNLHLRAKGRVGRTAVGCRCLPSAKTSSMRELRPFLKSAADLSRVSAQSWRAFQRWCSSRADQQRQRQARRQTCPQERNTPSIASSSPVRLNCAHAEQWSVRTESCGAQRWRAQADRSRICFCRRQMSLTRSQMRVAIEEVVEMLQPWLKPNLRLISARASGPTLTPIRMRSTHILMQPWVEGGSRLREGTRRKGLAREADEASCIPQLLLWTFSQAKTVNRPSTALSLRNWPQIS